MNRTLSQTVHHACGCYRLHETNARTEAEAAQIEAQLQQKPCRDCQAETEPVNSKRLSTMEG